MTTSMAVVPTTDALVWADSSETNASRLDLSLQAEHRPLLELHAVQFQLTLGPGRWYRSKGKRTIVAELLSTSVSSLPPFGDNTRSS